LTISSFSPDEFPNRSVFVSIAVFVVIFFSISSIYVLLGDITKAMSHTKIGFVSIICFMVFIGIVNIINIVDPDIWNQFLGMCQNDDCDLESLSLYIYQDQGPL